MWRCRQLSKRSYRTRRRLWRPLFEFYALYTLQGSGPFEQFSRVTLGILLSSDGHHPDNANTGHRGCRVHRRSPGTAVRRRRPRCRRAGQPRPVLRSRYQTPRRRFRRRPPETAAGATSSPRGAVRARSAADPSPTPTTSTSGRPAGVRPASSPRKYDEVNVNGTRPPRCLPRRGHRRFVMASSSSVYGKPRYLPFDEPLRTLPSRPTARRSSPPTTPAPTATRTASLRSLGYFSRLRPPVAPEHGVSNFVSRCHIGEPPVSDGDARKPAIAPNRGCLDANMTLRMKTPPTGRP